LGFFHNKIEANSRSINHHTNEFLYGSIHSFDYWKMVVKRKLPAIIPGPLDNWFTQFLQELYIKKFFQNIRQCLQTLGTAHNYNWNKLYSRWNSFSAVLKHQRTLAQRSKTMPKDRTRKYAWRWLAAPTRQWSQVYKPSWQSISSGKCPEFMDWSPNRTRLKNPWLVVKGNVEKGMPKNLSDLNGRLSQNSLQLIL